jgi:hypothetical protein
MQSTGSLTHSLLSVIYVRVCGAPCAVQCIYGIKESHRRWICICSDPLRMSARIAARVLMETKYVCKIVKGGYFFKYFLRHCFNCRPSDCTVLEDAGIEARTV